MDTVDTVDTARVAMDNDERVTGQDTCGHVHFSHRSTPSSCMVQLTNSFVPSALLHPQILHLKIDHYIHREPRSRVVLIHLGDLTQVDIRVIRKWTRQKVVQNPETVNGRTFPISALFFSVSWR